MIADHPRSRGVYPIALRHTHVLEGSSPLARGLPAERLPNRTGRGIIPARAGFTRASPQYCQPFSDHPRSRGVYEYAFCCSWWWFGSSPLARGLPDQGHGDAVPIGIIPARAGFTFSRRSVRSRISDHPRSRGVYPEVSMILTADEDHPRSRGVYLSPRQHEGPGAGSSPLARGLLSRPEEQVALGGIIPARAGFTADALGDAGKKADHPRSRGVYWPPRFRASRPRGSSPLARGLRSSPIHTSSC